MVSFNQGCRAVVKMTLLHLWTAFLFMNLAPALELLFKYK